MDPRTRGRLLERTQSIPAGQLGRLHGAMCGIPVSARRPPKREKMH